MFLAASYSILGTYLVYKNTNKMPPVQPETKEVGELTYSLLQVLYYRIKLKYNTLDAVPRFLS